MILRASPRGVVTLALCLAAVAGSASASAQGSEALVAALGRADGPAVAALLEAGADASAPSDRAVWAPALNAAVLEGARPLAVAAATGHVGLVRALLDAGADPNTADSAGAFSPLGAALRYGRRAAARALIAAGALPTDVDLAIAAGSEDGTWTEMLLAAGGAPGPRALLGAIEKRDTTLVRRLVLEGADLDEPFRPGLFREGGPRTPFEFALVEAPTRVVRVLLEAGADPNGPSSSETLLRGVLSRPRYGRVSLARALVEAGARTDGLADVAERETGVSVPALLGYADVPLERRLYEAVVTLHDPDEARALLAEGADPDVRLDAIPGAGSSDGLIEEVVIDIEETDDGPRDLEGLRDTEGAPLLFVALGDSRTVRAFLEAGADPDVANRYGATALGAALAAGREQSAEALLEAGADPGRLQLGRSPRAIALAMGMTRLAQRLEADSAGDLEADPDLEAFAEENRPPPPPPLPPTPRPADRPAPERPLPAPGFAFDWDDVWFEAVDPETGEQLRGEAGEPLWNSRWFSTTYLPDTPPRLLEGADRLQDEVGALWERLDEEPLYVDRVTVHFFVRPDGTVDPSTVSLTTGYTGSGTLEDEVAGPVLEAVGRLRFEPGAAGADLGSFDRADGEPVGFTGEIGAQVDVVRL